MKNILDFLKARPGALVFLAAAAVGLPALALPYVFDDVLSVRDNPALRALSSLGSLFGPEYERVFRNESFEPLTYVVLMAAGRLFAWQPWGLHLLSLLAHAACAWAVYALARSLFGGGKRAFLAGLFFALHPVQAESLVAVLFTGTVFSALFFLLALRRFSDEEGGGRTAGAALTGLLFGLSLLFKERAFSGLLLFGLLPLLKPGGGLRELRRRLPELLWLAFFWAAALLSRLPAGRGSALGAQYLDPAYLFARLAAYAKMLAAPFWLSPVYQKASPWPGAVELAALAAAGAVLHQAFKDRARGGSGYRPAAFGSLLFAVLLLPYLNLLPVSDLAEYLSSVFVSTRYLYLPLAGAALVFAACCGRLAGLFPARALAAGGGALAAVFVWLFAGQLLIWRDDEAVWLRAVRLNPGSAWANYMLGSYYLKEGRPEKAGPPLEKAAAAGPSRGVLSNTLGALAALRVQAGDPAGGAALAQKALEVWKYNYDAWNTYGAALAGLGRAREAAEAFATAASSGALGDAPALNLGIALLGLGEPGKAAEAFELALERNKSARALDLLCAARAAEGRREKAAEACLASVELEPGRPEALLRLADIYAKLGMKEPEALCRAEAARLSSGIKEN